MKRLIPCSSCKRNGKITGTMFTGEGNPVQTAGHIFNGLLSQCREVKRRKKEK